MVIQNTSIAAYQLKEYVSQVCCEENVIDLLHKRTADFILITVITLLCSASSVKACPIYHLNI